MKKFALTTHSSRSFFSQHWSHAVKPGCLAMALLVASALPAMAQTPAGGGKQQTTESQTPEKKVIYRGVVIDDTDAPLPGVSVTLPHSKGTGVTTDVNGRFEISVPESVHNLVFSYIGMKTQTVRVKGITKDITVRLESDAVNLKEAVVTGIYTRNAESFTGSMATYTNKELKQVGNLNVLQSLQALDPAFVITDNNLRGADPNATLDISIRGTTNLTDLESDYEYDPNQPLFILDGFESDLTTITTLTIDRVASITILKDAASTAIYGSKAANGVVVVETVKPEPGKLRFSYSGNYQVAWADLTDYNMMNAREKLAYEKLAGRYASGDYNLDANGEIIDEDQRQIYYNRLKLVEQGLDSYWLNEPLRTAFTQTHNIYVDGGDSAFLYGVGVNYSNTQGVMKGSGKDALNGNIRLTYRVDRLSFSNNTNLNYNTSDTEPVAFRNFVNANPYYSKYNENGEITKYFERTATLSGYEYAYNPLWDFNQKSYNRTNTFSLNNNFQVEWRILEELRLRGRFGVTIAQNESTVFHSPEETMFAETDRLERGTYAKNSSRDTSYDGTLDLTYGRTFGNHMLNLIGGMQFTESNSDAEAFSALGYMSDQYSNPNFSMGYPDGGKPSSTVVKSRTASYYFNLNYGYDMRYLVDLNLRTDGASVFGINNPFSTTWSFGLGWNVHNEKFLAAVYNYYTAFQNPFGLAALVSQWGNKDLEWQRTLDQNIGIDLAFMDDRLRFTFDYFTKTTDPLLLSISLPPSTGTTTSPMNIGTMHNEGFTWQATYFVLRGNDYNWSLTANMNHVKTSYDDMGNYLEYLNEQGRDEEAYTLRRYYDGASPTALWAVRSAGIDPMTGNEVFIKKDGSYTFEWDTADEVVCGDTTPDVEGTFGTSAYWKGFSMNLIFSYRYGGQAFRQTLFDKVENISESDLMYNQDKRAYYDRWQKPGDHAKFKRIDDLSESHMTSRFIEDENTLKLTTLSFGYENQTAPWLKTIGASSFNVRLSMNDLFYLSTIKEERGLDYPFQRSVMMSLGLSF